MKRFFSLIATAGLLAFSAQAAIVFTFEGPGVQSTTVATPTIVETFDSLAPGTTLNGYVSAIGTYSGLGVVVAPDQFGGAGQTNYASVGTQTAVGGSYTIDFGKDIFYFGFYWPAGDPNNVIEFYDGAVLVASFSSSASVVPLLANPAYNGNPNNGQNAGEKYVFLNFTSQTAADKFTSVKIINNSTGTGFESDNHTISEELITIPGVPEPATFGLAGAALVALGLKLRRRKN